MRARRSCWPSLLLCALAACDYDASAPLFDAAASDAAADASAVDGFDAPIDVDASDALIDAVDAVEVDAAQPPVVTASVIPIRVAANDSVPLTFTISGPAGTTIDWSMQAATVDDVFMPASGTVAVNGAGVGVITMSYVAPATPGDRSHLLRLASITAGTSDESVELKVRTLVTIGESAAFADNASLLIAADTLYGQALTTPSAPMIVMRLALVSHGSGYSGRMALYTDVAGEPFARVAQTGVEAIPSGVKEYRVTPAQLAPNATYWLFGDFTASAPVRRHPTQNAAIRYSPLATATPLPTQLGAQSSTGQRRLNFYLLVAE